MSVLILILVILFTPGKIALSHDIEIVAMEISNSKIPNDWLMKSYPSMKSLGSFVKDLKQKIDILQVIKSTYLLLDN